MFRLQQIVVNGWHRTLVLFTKLHEPGRKRRRSIFYGLFAVFAIIVGVIVWMSLPGLSSQVASSMLANFEAPSDQEYAPTISIVSLSSSEVQSLAGRGEGLNCSIPWAAKFIFERGEIPGLQYRQACVKHDLCYRHGAETYGYSQSDCDRALVQDAYRLCLEGGGDEDRRRSCIDAARKVYLGVFAGGASAFKAAGATNGLGSTYSEFDAYPAPFARLAAPRATLDKAGNARLHFYLQRSGGSEINTYRLKDDRVVIEGSEALPGRYDFLVAPPMISRAAGSDWLVFWRRRNKESFSTDGIIEFSSPSKAASLQTALSDLDTGTAQLFNVAGTSPDGLIHLVGVMEHKGNYGSCGQAPKGTNIAHVFFNPLDPRDGKSGCEFIPVVIDGLPGPRGAFLHAEPRASYQGNTLLIRLSRRTNEGLRTYSEVLRVAEVRIPLVQNFPASARSYCLSLPEIAEPVALLGDRRVTGISFVRRDDKSHLFVARETNCDDLQKPQQIQLNYQAALAFQGRIAMIESPNDGKRVSTTSWLVGIAPAGKLQFDNTAILARVILIGLRGPRVTRCLVMDILARYLERAALADKSQSAVPILADMNADGLADLILALRADGRSSLVFPARMQGSRYTFSSNDRAEIRTSAPCLQPNA